MRAMVLALALALGAVPAAAPVAAPTAGESEQASEIAGTWVLTAEGRTVFVLELAEGRDGIAGTLVRPDEITWTARGDVITGVKLPLVTYTLSDGGRTPDGQILNYSFAHGGRSGRYLIRPDGNDGLIFAADVAPGAPRAVLHRPWPAAEVATDWRDGRHYRVDGPVVSPNAEMREIFAADQADRQLGPGIDWATVAPRDAARRARVREMLDQGLLRTGEDFYAAAFVFQHGEASKDFLLAHALAMAAQARGHAGAAWIAAATLDRFLRRLDRPQVFGTQFVTRPGQPTDQEEYDRAMIPDEVRSAVGVPTLAEQAVQLEQMRARNAPAASAP